MKLWALCSCVLLLFNCCNSNKESASSTSEKVWLFTEPIQCLGNPWEQDWLAEHNNDYDAYPRGQVLELEAQEMAIITDYFAEQGIQIHTLYSEPFGDDVVVCDACHCPQGYYLFIQVDRNKQAQLEEEFGFQPKETTP